jgi:16S rRNA (cytidine1402-2'-O)-methyltransferase
MSVLHLLPVGISEETSTMILPARTVAAAHALRHFVAENARSARRALKELGHPVALQELDIRELPVTKERKPFTAAELADLLSPLIGGEPLGVISESGCPGIADPGAEFAAWAQANGHTVVPHVGPSSVLLALMGSGLEGQRFSFHGYLPVDPQARTAEIIRLEFRSAREQATQLFIETPYRNEAMCEALLQSLQPATRLTLACDLTGPGELLQTRRIDAWRAAPPALPRLPTVFLFQADAAMPPPVNAPAATRRRRG